MRRRIIWGVHFHENSKLKYFTSKFLLFSVCKCLRCDFFWFPESRSLFLLRLVGLFTLVLVFRESFENRSVSEPLWSDGSNKAWRTNVCLHYEVTGKQFLRVPDPRLHQPKFAGILSFFLSHLQYAWSLFFCCVDCFDDHARIPSEPPEERSVYLRLWRPIWNKGVKACLLLWRICTNTSEGGL